MNVNLEKAIDRLRARTDEEQDSIATLIMEELDGEAAWDDTFKASPDKLRRLAQAALAEYHAGETTALEPDAL